jgi:hypothetical protein
LKSEPARGTNIRIIVLSLILLAFLVAFEYARDTNPSITAGFYDAVVVITYGSYSVVVIYMSIRRRRHSDPASRKSSSDWAGFRRHVRILITASSFIIGLIFLLGGLEGGRFGEAMIELSIPFLVLGAVMLFFHTRAHRALPDS